MEFRWQTYLTGGMRQHPRLSYLMGRVSSRCVFFFGVAEPTRQSNTVDLTHATLAGIIYTR